MGEQLEKIAAEVKDLRRCINDLIGVLALRAIWSGGDSSRIVDTLADVLLDTLRLDLICVRFQDPFDGELIEEVRFSESRRLSGAPEDVSEAVDDALGREPYMWPSRLRCRIGDSDVFIVPLQLGLHGEIGTILAGARRIEFPLRTEKLVLTVAANQAAIGLQEARLLSEQKRVADELDRRVTQRTAELAATNEKLGREIAERKLVEERLRQEERELRRSEAFLAEAQRLSSTGSFSWRIDADEITWSEQLYRIFELDPKMPVTRQLIGLRVHPEDILSVNEMIDRMRNECEDFEAEYRLQMPDSAVKYLRLVAHGTHDPSGGSEYIGTVQDVTDRRLAEEALSKARSQLVHVDRVISLGILTASIAHEVNQPLARITINASTCLRVLAADPGNVDRARAIVQRTIHDARHASEVIARLRALFSNKTAVAEQVNLNEATREVLALSSSELQRGRVILRTHLDERLPPVTGDRIQLQQVILNLILNASAAMSGIDDRPRHLTIRTEREQGDRVRLAVEDAGVGLDPQNVDRLFDAFYSTKSSGMGIGLSVSRSIIESHHGKLWAARNNGSGATFSFSIPCGPMGSQGRDTVQAADGAPAQNLIGRS